MFCVGKKPTFVRYVNLLEYFPNTPFFWDCSIRSNHNRGNISESYVEMIVIKVENVSWLIDVMSVVFCK